MGNEIVKRTTLEHGSSAVGAGLGVGAASAIGALVGSTGLLGTIGSAFGVTVAASTPVGWLIAGGFAGGVALKYGSKIIGKKGESDGSVATMDAIISERNQKRMERVAAKIAQADVVLTLDLLDQIKQHSDEYDEFVIQIKNGVEQGVIPPNEAMSIACEILDLPVDGYLQRDKVTIEELNFSALASVVMMSADGTISNEEIDVFVKSVSSNFSISYDDAEFVLNQQIEQYSVFQNKVKNYYPLQIFLSIARTFKNNKRLMRIILNLLIEIVESDGDFEEDEKIVYATVYDAFNMALQQSQYEKLIFDFPYLTTEDASKNNVFLNTDENFDKKMRGALAAYATGIMPNYVVGVYHAAVLGKVKNGFVINDLGVVRNDGKMILFNQIRSASYDDVKEGITIATVCGDFWLSCKSKEMAGYFDRFGKIEKINSMLGYEEIVLPEYVCNAINVEISHHSMGNSKFSKLRGNIRDTLGVVKSEVVGAKNKVGSKWKDTDAERQEIKKSTSRILKKIFKK